MASAICLLYVIIYLKCEGGVEESPHLFVRPDIILHDATRSAVAKSAQRVNSAAA